MDHIPSCPGSYKITHRESGFFYVGSSKNIRGRIRHHLSNLRRGTHVNKTFQTNFDSTDTLDIEFNQFETLSQARDHEQELINLYLGDPKCCNVGNGSYSTWQKGTLPFMLRDVDRRHTLGNQYAKGHVVSDAVKDAVRAANTGRVRSGETRAKMSDAKSAMKRAVEIHGVTYDGVREASIALGISKETIRSRALSANTMFAEWVFV